MKSTAGTMNRGAMAIAILSLSGGLHAQEEAVMSAPEASLTAPALRKPAPTTLSQPAEPSDALLQWGSLIIHPHVLGRGLYGQGLPTRDGRHVTSMIYTMAPGLQVDFGERWTFDYTPTWTNYTARALEDTVAHSVRASGAWVMQDWTMQVSESYRKSTPLLIETGGQTPQRTWSTQLGAERSFGSGLAFQSTASLDERYSDSFPDTRDWAIMNWLTLRFTPHFETGLGLGAGYSDIVREPDATNERYMARFRWNPADKLSLDIDGGLEVRHSRAAGAEDQNNPIYNATFSYRPFDVTQITVGGTGAVRTSYYQNQVTESKGWNVGVQQRLLEKFFLNATFNHQESDFTAVSPLAIFIPQIDPLNPVIISLPGRSDRVDGLNLRIFTTLLKHWRISASYARSKNRSSQAEFNYNSTQYGLEISRRF